MFERFTIQARTLVRDAQQESRDLGHHYVGTEHLLLGLLAPQSGGASGVLGGAGLTADRVRADIVSNLADESMLDQQDAEALKAIGIDLNLVRAKIEETFGPGALCPTPRPRRGLFRRRRKLILPHQALHAVSLTFQSRTFRAPPESWFTAFLPSSTALP